MISPGVEIGPVPVFSDLVSLQYIRPEVGRRRAVRQQRSVRRHVADPDNYLNRADRRVRRPHRRQGRHPIPGFTDAAISSSYAGCYDVTPDWNPVISKTGIDGLIVAAGFSGHGFKIAPGRRPPGRRPRSSTAEATTRGSRSPTSGCPGSPRATRSRARIRMSAPARCDDSWQETCLTFRCFATSPAPPATVIRTRPSRNSSSRPRSAAMCGSCGSSRGSRSPKWPPASAFPRR